MHPPIAQDEAALAVEVRIVQFSFMCVLDALCRSSPVSRTYMTLLSPMRKVRLDLPGRIVELALTRIVIVNLLTQQRNIPI